jgi:hypothetical protein
VEGVTGKYFVKCKAVPSAPASYDRDAAARLWRAAQAGFPQSEKHRIEDKYPALLIARGFSSGGKGIFQRFQ